MNSIHFELDKYLKAVEFVLEMEGVFSDELSDLGGKTKYGISAKAYPDIDIVNLRKSQALKIYYDDYWMMLRCNDVTESLATVLFDTGINCGVGSSAKWLQRACNKKGSQLVVDGIIGLQSLLAISMHDQQSLISGIIGYRLKRYSALVKKNPSQNKFLRGWVNRVADLLFYVL